MTTIQTAASYNQIAQHWAEESFNHENGIAQHERALAFAPSEGHAIDIGCGSSGRILSLLQKHGYGAEGLDFSTEMLALARLKHPDVLFHHADICTWEFLHHYDFISAWDSIWHVPLKHHPAVLEKLCGALAPGGVLIFTSGGVDAPDEVTNPCHGQPLYHAALGIPELLRLIDQYGCICRHLEYDQPPELHVYFIVQKIELRT